MAATLLGYCDRNSARPGDSIRFMVSAEETDAYEVVFVRLTCCDAGQTHPPYRELRIETPADGMYPARVQPIACGSSVLIPDPRRVTALTAFSMLAYVWPTRLGPVKGGPDRQALLGNWDEETARGYGLEIDSTGCLSLRVGSVDQSEVFSLTRPLVE